MDHVYESLKRKFKSVHFKPGSPVVIGQLSETMSVSHIPIREALARLSEEGHAEHVAGHGFFARRIEPQIILECYTCLEVTLLRSIDRFCETSGSSVQVAAELRGLFDVLGALRESHEIAHAVETLLVSILNWLDNRYLARAGMSAIEQIYFILEAQGREPSLLEHTRRLAGHSAKAFQNGQPQRAKVMVSRSISYAKTQINSHIKTALQYASKHW